MTQATYWIEVGCEVYPREGIDIETHFLAIMDALMVEPRITDPDITAELARGRIIISMAVEAATDRSALELAILCARSAIHKAGGHTPDWGAPPPSSPFAIEDGFDARVRPAPVENHAAVC